MVNFGVLGGFISLVIGVMCLCPIPVYLNVSFNQFILIASSGNVFIIFGLITMLHYANSE